MKKVNLILIALIFSGVLFSQEIINSSFQGKHHMISKSELGNEKLNYKSFTETAPPIGTVRPIAEFEQMSAVIVAYMSGWGGYFGIPVSLIASMSEVVTVITIVENSSQQSTVLDFYNNNGVNTDNCEFLFAPIDSYWTRDFSPWFIAVNNEVSVINFPYNRPRPNDNDVPIAFASAYGYNLYGMNVLHTGGNFMNDGISVAASTELVYEENDDQTEVQVDSKLASYMGVTNHMVINDPQGEYIKHIDCWGKFLDVDKVLIGQVPSTSSQYDEYEAVADYFANTESSYGTNYQVYRTYSPNGQPYTNSLILNNRVFIPFVDGSAAAWNDDALAVYQQAMPGYEIIGFTAGSSNWEATDALHCRTHEVPDRGMLHIFHIPTQGLVDYSNEYPITAEIVPYSGADITQATLFYNPDGEGYNQITMTNSGGDTYFASIPELPENTQVSYYIHAEDNSPRTANHPYIGEPDPHVFIIGENPNLIFDIANMNFILKVYPNPADKELFVNLFSEIDVPAEISIIDIHGKTLATERIELIPGNKIVKFDISHFASGMYAVNVIYGNKKIVNTKFLVE
ncbi:MAG: agmatine deiminase family protein [Bacteroidales bacterium]|nr:agmatine deiminase family protein [Bacteroidales bacterium]